MFEALNFQLNLCQFELQQKIQAAVVLTAKGGSSIYLLLFCFVVEYFIFLSLLYFVWACSEYDMAAPLVVIVYNFYYC